MRRIWMLIPLAAAAAFEPPPVERIPPFVKTVELPSGLPPLEIRVVPAEPSEDPSAPLGRVEILREGVSGGDGEAIVAAASTAHRVPRATESLDLADPGGWKIRLRAPGPVATVHVPGPLVGGGGKGGDA